MNLQQGLAAAKNALDIIELVAPFIPSFGGPVAHGAELIEANLGLIEKVAPIAEQAWDINKPLVAAVFGAVKDRMGLRTGPAAQIEAAKQIHAELGVIFGWTREETERAFALQGADKT